MLLPKQSRLRSPSLLMNSYYVRIYVVVEDVGMHSFPKPKNIIENKVIDIDACNSLYSSRRYVVNSIHINTCMPMLVHVKMLNISLLFSV